MGALRRFFSGYTAPSTHEAVDRRPPVWLGLVRRSSLFFGRLTFRRPKPSTQQDLGLTIADWRLEGEIHRAHRQLVNAPNLTARRLAFERMKALIAQRSPAQIAHMERERALR